MNTEQFVCFSPVIMALSKAECRGILFAIPLPSVHESFLTAVWCKVKAVLFTLPLLGFGGDRVDQPEVLHQGDDG